MELREAGFAHAELCADVCSRQCAMGARSLERLRLEQEIRE